MQTRNRLFSIFLVLSLTSGPAHSQHFPLLPIPGSKPSLYGARITPVHAARPTVTGEAVVRFRRGVPLARQQQAIGAFGCQISRIDVRSGYLLVRVRDGRLTDLLSLLARRADVLVCEPSYWLYPSARLLYEPYQWYLFDRGAVSAAAVSNFGIQAASAWKYTRGAGVTVAVLDTGVAYERYQQFHRAPSLAQTRFTRGYDFVHNDDHPNDDNGHGTHVTSILAATLVDGGGMNGVASEVTVMPVKVLSSAGPGRDFDIAQGICWAADNGASVLNMSLGGESGGTVLSDACNYAADKGCVLVAASGNEHQAEVGFPAIYSPCIAVGATGFDGKHAPYSNRGRRLSVVAPGGNVLQDLNGDHEPDGIIAETFHPPDGFDRFRYKFWQGTSMAAPQVAGVAAMVRAVNPALTPLEVRTKIQDTAIHLGAPGRNVFYGYGLVDAVGAVEAAMPQR